jgi:hypothetical protein
MNTAEAKEQVRETAVRIRDELVNLEQETGLSVSRIEIDATTLKSMGQPETRVVGVEIEVVHISHSGSG